MGNITNLMDYKQIPLKGRQTYLNPTLAGIIINSINQGLNLVDLLVSVLHLCMHECTHPAGIVRHNAACRVESHQFNLARWLAVLVSLLFITIPTSFSNFYLFLVDTVDRVESV